MANMWYKCGAIEQAAIHHKMDQSKVIGLVDRLYLGMVLLAKQLDMGVEHHNNQIGL